jgi:hypothetical protein
VLCCVSFYSVSEPMYLAWLYGFKSALVLTLFATE